MKRVQSPSSINTYIQCPRKYFFIYNLKLPCKPSIHLVRGSAAHSALEDFFLIMPEIIGEDYHTELKIILLSLLNKHWKKSEGDLSKLELTDSEINMFYKETQQMLSNWAGQFTGKIDSLVRNGMSFANAFEKLKPITEEEYKDEELMVRGFIDAIEKNEGVRLMDYKTSKRAHITDAYRLQLGIYAMLYERKHGKRPDKVGIYFLREGEQVIDVDDSLILDAKFQIEQIHSETENNDDINKYPKKESPLCKWSSGQCDFYEYCFQGKKIPEK